MPDRTCIGCRKVRDKSGLVRITVDLGGMLTVDKDGRGGGRGGYICPSDECLIASYKGDKRCFARAFKGDVVLPTMDDLKLAIKEGALLNKHINQ